MPLQNRVDPFGDLHAIDARGTLMGNRGGRIHRDDRTLGLRRHASRQWIACECSFRGRQRSVWGAGYTELFFLDEVTALAAGHRPCFECRRADATTFAQLFPAPDGQKPTAPSMDRLLHDERCDEGRLKRTYDCIPATLPDGAMFTHAGAVLTRLRGTHLLWSHRGYTRGPDNPSAQARLLTPPSIVETLRRGFAPRWHDSAAALASPIPPPR